MDIDGQRMAFLYRGSVYGGAEESMIFNARDLASRGVAVEVFCFGSTDLRGRFVSAGLSTVDGTSPDEHRRAAFLARLALSIECRCKGSNRALAGRLLKIVCRREMTKVAQMIRERQVHVLYCNMGAAHDSQFIRAATNVGIRTISHQRREPPVFAGRRILEEVNADCSAFISNSVWTRNQWLHRGLRAERHEVIYNTIVPSEAAPTGLSLRAQLRLPSQARLVASLGRLAEEKRFAWGIEAFAAVASEFDNWHYVIIGDGEESEHLRRVAAGTACGARIHFTGEIRAAAACLREVDVLLHPNPEEPFGRVVAEAMLAENIVVGHASGGVLEMIKDGEHGFLFDDRADLPAVLRRAMRATGSTDLARRARARIESLCGRRNSDRLADLVAGVLRGPSAFAAGQ